MDLTDVPNALGYLNDLGSADSIANFLDVCGFRGVRGCEEECAVVSYLTWRTEAADLAVLPMKSLAGGSDPLPPAPVVIWTESASRRGRQMELPQHVNDFALSFDRGVYPQLVLAQGELA